MADKKISALSAAAALDGTEDVPIVQSSATVRTTTQDIADLASPGTDVWANYTPTWTNLTVGNGTLNRARYTGASGGTVKFEVDFTFGSTTSISGHVRVSVPVAAAAGYKACVAYYLDSGTRNWVGNAVIGEYTANDAAFHEVGGGSAGNVTSTTPFTWTTGDRIVLTGQYEAA